MSLGFTGWVGWGGVKEVAQERESPETKNCLKKEENYREEGLKARAILAFLCPTNCKAMCSEQK